MDKLTTRLLETVMGELTILYVSHLYHMTLVTKSDDDGSFSSSLSFGSQVQKGERPRMCRTNRGAYYR